MDPKDTDIYKQVVDFDLDVKSIPEWDEIREVEYVRQRGEINMITENVARWCIDRGLLNGAAWIIRCQENKRFWGSVYDKVLEHFEIAYGPRDKWITPEYRKRIETNELEIEIVNAERKLRELRKRKSK